MCEGGQLVHVQLPVLVNRSIEFNKFHCNEQKTKDMFEPRKGGDGGSYQIKPKNLRTKPKANRKENAMIRVHEKLGGKHVADGMVDMFKNLMNHRKPVGCVYDTADGVLLAAREFGCSDLELRTLFGVGAHRVSRLRVETNLVVKKDAPDHVVPDIFLPDYVGDEINVLETLQVET